MICVDPDQHQVDQISAGVCPIHEAGLRPLLEKHQGRSFRATTDLKGAVHQSELTLIALGTPFKGKRIDRSLVEKAARQIVLRKLSWMPFMTQRRFWG